MATWDAILWRDDMIKADHVSDGLARLLWQYQGDHPRLQGLLEAFLTNLQGIEDVALEVFAGRWPLTAIGEQLDVLGRIVLQARGDMADAQYRLWILARIAVNRSNGKIEELINILTILGPETMRVREHGNAELEIDITGMADGDDVGDLMAEAKAGGVSLHWKWSAENTANVFTFGAVGSGVTTNALQGFGETGGTPTTGGYLMMENKT